MLQCEYRHQWDEAFRALIQETIHTPNSGWGLVVPLQIPNDYLGSVISKILEWEKMDLSTLQATLDELVKECTNCQQRGYGNSNDLQTHLKRTAITCRNKIQSIPSFSGF